ncbi:PAS domain-containing protein [Maridesulfovibrio sp.]|uniref:PAS domain-containing protein n=1 Tax=Maridesulfovibrio sp. TaxID=2795000 RepID=UPI002A18C5A1|nr:PAS domain-containing protein [Maridesulfovibrio sp.]
MFSQDQEKQYRILLDEARQYLAIVRNGQVCLCTAELAALLECSREELISKDLCAHIHPDHAKQVDQYHSNLTSGLGTPEGLELKAVTETGRILWLGLSGIRINWEGSPATLDFFTDITERKNTESKTDEERDRLALALDIADMGVWEWRADRNEMYLNATIFTMLGYDPDELPHTPETMKKLLHPEDLPGTEKKILQHIEHGNAFDLQFRMRSKLGSYRWINSKCKVLRTAEDGQVIRMIGTHQDVTEAHEARSALKESQERYKALNEATSGGIIIHDQGTIIDTNHRLSEISGYSQEELHGMDGLLLVSPGSRNEVMQRVLSGYEKPYEVMGLRKNGEEYPLQVEARNIFYKDKQLRVVEFRDITESRQAQKEKFRLRTQLDALWQISRMVEAEYSELNNLMLREAQAMTSSEYSFIGLMDDSLKTLSLQAWSPDVAEGCAISDTQALFSIHEGSIWSTVLRERRYCIINDYEKTEKTSRELPQGHVPIKRVLVIPIIRNDKVAALAAVANKKEEYTEEDAFQLTAYVSNVLILLEKRRTEKALRSSEKKLEMALEIAVMGQWELDLRTNIFTLNNKFYLIYGTSSEQEGGLTMSTEDYARNFVHPDDMEMVFSTIIDIFQRKYDSTPAQIEHRIIRRDGEVRHILVRFTVIKNKSNELTSALGVNQDITRYKKTLAELHKQQRRLADIIRGTNTGTWEWNVQTGETIFNERWAQMIGYELDELLPTTIDKWTEICHPEDITLVRNLLEKHFNGTLEYYECEARIKHKNGDWIWVLDRGKVASWTEDGKPLLMSGTRQDITEKKRVEEEILHLANHDTLTGLPTLRLVKDRIGLAFSIARRKKQLSAVCFVDLDGFKNVNDTLGHDAGDALLKEVALRLKSCVREIDTVARIGGDEFLVVLTELKSRDDAGLVAEKIVKTIGTPWQYGGTEICIGASVGISICGECKGAEDVESVIKQADSAMYRIKKSGKNGYGFADECII